MYISLLVLGLAAGILSGLFGIGGGVIMVPMLITVFGLTLTHANATSLAAMLLPVGVLGVIEYYKANLINIKESLWIALGLTLGSAIGAEFAVSIPENTLKMLYSLFLLYVAISFLDIPSYFKKEKIPSNKLKKVYSSVFPFVILGFLAGIIAGMFGKGGGMIIVPALIAFFNYDTKQATGTSLAALQLPVGLPGVVIYAQNGSLNYYYAGLIALGIVIGAFFGTKMAIKLPNKLFKKIYAAFLLLTVGILLFK